MLPRYAAPAIGADFTVGSRPRLFTWRRYAAIRKRQRAAALQI